MAHLRYLDRCVVLPCGSLFCHIATQNAPEIKQEHARQFVRTNILDRSRYLELAAKRYRKKGASDLSFTQTEPRLEIVLVVS
jgi:hypothetical protein